ncbi:MAG TPA: MBL fold metallo-hydrolase [Methanomicrobia archaeon]|nr:MBL fold metallo-hydrolase [Methanomicrobia archaeon]
MKLRDGLYWYRERGFFDANTFVISDERTILIDPGLGRYIGPRLRALREDGIEPADIDLIAVTHLHPDHCGATAELKEITGAKIALHPLQVDYFEAMDEGSQDYLGVGIEQKFSADLLLEERLSLGGLELEIIETPGHSPCSICFCAPARKFLICGDLVFEQGVGRTDLPFGDTGALKASIDRIARLDTELLLPGHGAVLHGYERIQRNYEFVKRMFSAFL